jgi:phage terminase Nu1 subunit (DNA packaging protein)
VTDAKTLTQHQAAEILGLTLRHFQRLAREPDAPPKLTNVNGRATGFSCRAFGKWLRVRWAAELGVDSTGKVYDEKLERARLLHHQANIAALDEAVKQKRLIPADVVLDRWDQIGGNVRAKLLSLPTQLAATCAGLSRDEIEEKAGDLIRQALDELSADPAY